MLPNFFLAGAPKAGTTALHVALARHPGIFMSPVKEPKHFLYDGPPPTRGGPGDARMFRASVWRREEYEALFTDAPHGARRGESTSLYLYDADALRRMHDAVPDARLVVLLRDPVDRAHSNWTHLYSAGLEPEDFLAACDLEEERAANGWATFWRYLDLGRYGRQVAALCEIFPREQVLVLRYRLLREEPLQTVNRVCAFLGVPPGVIGEIPPSNVTTHVSGSARNQVISRLLRGVHAAEELHPGSLWAWADSWLSRRLQREQRPRVPLTSEQRKVLIPRIADDVARLEAVTGESFGDWLDAGTPMRWALTPSGRIGTGHYSIDRPVRSRLVRTELSPDST